MICPVVMGDTSYIRARSMSVKNGLEGSPKISECREEGGKHNQEREAAAPELLIVIQAESSLTGAHHANPDTTGWNGLRTLSSASSPP
jgi:hypothetical protein